MERISGKDWEVVNKKAGVDVLDIVVNLDGRYTPSQQADLIVERCEITAKIQLEICEKEHNEVVREIFDCLWEHSTAADAPLIWTIVGFSFSKDEWQEFKEKYLKPITKEEK